MNTASKIVAYEARRDANGKLRIYKLPANDGGGSYEIAGINDKYHPKMAARLRDLINAGKQDQAEKEAADYIESYAAPVAQNATNAGVKFAIQDAAFNRGPTGAAKILQMALGVEADGKIGPKTRAALAEAEKDPKALLQRFRVAREEYEKQVAGVRKNLWRGLVNRWDNQLRDALALA